MPKRSIILLLIGLFLLGGVSYFIAKQLGGADTAQKELDYVGFHENNVKKPDLYQDKPVIVVSAKYSIFFNQTIAQSSLSYPMHHWNEVLPSIPIAVWSNKKREVQQIPVLVVSGVVDDDNFRGEDFSAIYFLKQYKPNKVIIPKDDNLKKFLTTNSIYGAKIPQEKIIEIENFFTNPSVFWQSFEEVVLVDEDYGKNDVFGSKYEEAYENALLASSYASFINAPFISNKAAFDNIIGNQDLASKLKQVILVGDATEDFKKYIQEKTNLVIKNSQEIQKDIYELTKTNKFILVDTFGTMRKAGEKIINEYTGEETTEKVRDDSKILPGREGLLAPLLAAGKKELIIPIRSNSNRYPTKGDRAAAVNDEFRSRLDSLGIKINGDQYLTITANGDSIPQAVKALSRQDIRYSNGEHLAYDTSPEYLGGSITKEELDNRLYGAKENRSNEYRSGSATRSWFSDAVRDIAHFVGDTIATTGGWIGEGVEWIGSSIGGDIGEIFGEAGQGITQGTTWLGGGIEVITNTGMSFGTAMVGWIVRPGQAPDEILIESFINGMSKSIDIHMADPKIDKAPEIHFKTGRLYGSSGDLSGYFARDFFYDYLPNKSNRSLSVIAGDDELFRQYLHIDTKEAQEKLRWWHNNYIGWKNYKSLFSSQSKEYYGTVETQAKKQEIFDQYQRSGFVIYADHASSSGWKDLLYTHAFYLADIHLPPSIILSNACSTADPDSLYNFALANIRHGAIATYGSVDTNYVPRSFNEFFKVYGGTDMGTAMKNAKNEHNKGGMIAPMNFPDFNYVLIGDPTFAPSLPPKDDYPAEFLTDAVNTIDPSGIETGIGNFRLVNNNKSLPAVFAYDISDAFRNTFQNDIRSIDLSINTLMNQEIRHLVALPKNSGTNYVFWDGKDNQGRPVPNGSYIFKLQLNFTDAYLSRNAEDQKIPQELIYNASFIGYDQEFSWSISYRTEKNMAWYVGPELLLYDKMVNPQLSVPVFMYFRPSTATLVSAKIFKYNNGEHDFVRDLWQDKLVPEDYNVSLYWDGKDQQGKEVELNKSYKIELSFKKPSGEMFVDYYGNKVEYKEEYHIYPQSRDAKLFEYVNALEQFKSRMAEPTNENQISKAPSTIKAVDYANKSSGFIENQGAMLSFSGNQWLEYRINFGSEGSRFVAGLTATNKGVVPPDKYGFNIDVYVDGNKKGAFNLSAYQDQYQSQSFNLGSLKDIHRIKFVWTNDVYKPNVYDSNILIKEVFFRKIEAASASVKASQYSAKSRGWLDQPEDEVKTNIGNEWLDYTFAFSNTKKNYRLKVTGYNSSQKPLANSDVTYKVYLDTDGSGRSWKHIGSLSYPALNVKYQDGYLDLKDISGIRRLKISFVNDYYKKDVYDNNPAIKEISVYEINNFAPAISYLKQEQNQTYKWFTWKGADPENDKIYYRYKMESIREDGTRSFTKWSSWTTADRSTGYNLYWKNNYVFHIQAKDKNGNMGEIKTVGVK